MKSKPKIVNFINETALTEAQLARLRALGEFVEAPGRVLAPEEIKTFLADADYALFAPTSTPRLTADILAAGKNLKGVVVNTTNLGWVDTPAAEALKIPVHNIPGYSTEAVAEFTLGLMFALARNISFADREVKLRGETGFEKFSGMELSGKTLGVIGLGEIGGRVAEIALAIGMRVVASNRTEKAVPGVTLVSKDELTAGADIVSIHLALAEETRGFIGEKEFGRMRPGALLINVSREELIDQKAALMALKSGRLAGYALEMNEDQGAAELRELSRLDNVIATPHIAWFTPEARARAMELAVKKMEEIMGG